MYISIDQSTDQSVTPSINNQLFDNFTHFLNNLLTVKVTNNSIARIS